MQIKEYEKIKRVFDIVISVCAIIVSSPIWLIGIVGILISDPGPIFYMANRVGKNNKQFKMFKFRSMRVLKNSKRGSEASLRPETDRIFPWGKIIRKLKIDELPQFLNIFIGDMSVVGPRPVAKDQMNIFRIGRYDIAKQVKPGITGPAALYDYIYGDQFEEADIDEYMEKVLPIRRELEIVYVKKQGFMFDTWIFFETARCILCSLVGKENVRLLKKLVKMAQESDSELRENF
ncbi:sugar transferase [Lachnospiraceae bacterium WCA-9-b2]|uniref:Sugar transferase n=1 Tax=Sporofaciens musculi TaxID=2681861 RepID=A0A7X3MEY4_9FIRM|nr:sugar transferase [Sporofaciens musculi]MXP75111.1 sugar transferase [Sporofaciens musculi]